MKYYCEKCRCLHNDTEICPHIKEALKRDPSLLSQTASIVNIAGQQQLITSQALDTAAQKIGGLVGKELSYEGTKQIARDVQVFRRLDSEAFVRAGVFHTPDVAKSYLESSSKNQIKNLIAKINGSGQEVDWLRSQQGSLKALYTKSELFNKNAPGVDGEIVNRFTGHQITRVTVKTAQGEGGLNTNVQGIVKAVKLNRLKPDDQVFGAVGTKDALIKKLDKEIAYAKTQGDAELVNRLTDAKNMKVIEQNTPQTVAKNRDRILQKISDGNAYTHITTEQVFEKAADGAIIGAAIGLTISSIVAFVRYKNGELTEKEMLQDISEDTVKSALTGGSIGAISLFLPAGPVGFVAGMAIGIYLDASLTNILDEIWGKGAYLAVLNSSGYICGMAENLVSVLRDIQNSMQEGQSCISEAEITQEDTNKNLTAFLIEMENLL